MTKELNIFNATKQPHEEDEFIDANMIEELVEDSFISKHSDDPLEICLTHSSLSSNDDSVIIKVNVLLDATPIMDTVKQKTKLETTASFENKISHLLCHHQNGT